MKTMELERTASRSYTCYEAVRNQLSTTVCFENQEMNEGHKAFKHIVTWMAIALLCTQQWNNEVMQRLVQAH
jgi:hypothetical protein